MLAKNSNNGRLPTNFKSTKSNSTNKNSVIGVSNISVSISSSKKGTNRCYSKAKGDSAVAGKVDIEKSEIGVQVDEVEIIKNVCSLADEVIGDASTIRLPSAKVVKEIEQIRKQKKQELVKSRTCEPRKFEKYDAREEVHLTNLKEFLETGAITKGERKAVADQKSEEPQGSRDKTTKALKSYERFKQKEEELIELLNSI